MIPCRVSELNMQNVNVKDKSFDKIIRKFVAKLLKYRTLFKDILTFWELDYRDASLIILYRIVIGISTPKIKSIGLLYHIKIVC